MKNKYIYNNHTQKNFKKIIYCSLFYFIFNMVLQAPVYSKVEFCDPNVGWGPISKPGKNLLLEEFEDALKWNSWVFKNESLKLKNVKGLSGNALRIEYNIPDDSAFRQLSE